MRIVKYKCLECPKDQAPEPTTDLVEFEGHIFCVHGLTLKDLEVQEVLVRKVKHGTN